MSTKDRLTPEGQRLWKALKELPKYKVRIGYQAGQASEEVTDGNGNATGTVDMVDVVAWNELGTSTIPSRPFLRKSVDDNEDKLKAFSKSLKTYIAKGASVEMVLKKIGLFQKSLVQQKISEGKKTFQENAPSTIAIKRRKGKWNKKPQGETQPLVDEGTMRKSVNFFIEKR